MATFSLTSGNDVVVAPASGSTVYANAATLNPGDSLTGGSGVDVLDLIGAGTFDLSGLANFSGFEKVELQNGGAQYALLTLNGQPIELDITGYGQIFVGSQSNWNGSDIIKGDTSLGFASTTINFNDPTYGTPYTYDLTSNTFANVGNVFVGQNVTLEINSADAAGVQQFYGSGALQTSDAALDLTHTKIAGSFVSSSNALGTTFTVGDLGTALQVEGGPGNDTLNAQGFTFTANQRNAIFKTSSIETIIDPSGTYTVPALAPGEFTLTTGNDTVVAPASGSTVYANAATLNAGDSLTGGSGTDILELIGAGSFDLSSLTNFSGFEKVELQNAGSQFALLTLGGQPVEVDLTGYGEVLVSSPSNWNGSDVINGDISASTYIIFNSPTYGSQVTYDLTSNTLTNIWSVGLS